MTAQVEPVQLLVVGSNTPTTPAGTPLTLTTDYGNASIPAADGTNITWSVTAQPAGQDTQLPGERGGLDTSGWTVSAYTTFYQQDSWYMDGVITWGRNDYELLRRIRYTLPLAGGGTRSVDQSARADASGDLLSTAYTFGRDFNRGARGIGPYGRLPYTRVGFDAINETLEAGEPGSGLAHREPRRDLAGQRARRQVHLYPQRRLGRADPAPAAGVGARVQGRPPGGGGPLHQRPDRHGDGWCAAIRWTPTTSGSVWACRWC